MKIRHEQPSVPNQPPEPKKDEVKGRYRNLTSGASPKEPKTPTFESMYPDPHPTPEKMDTSVRKVKVEEPKSEPMQKVTQAKKMSKGEQTSEREKLLEKYRKGGFKDVDIDLKDVDIDENKKPPPFNPEYRGTIIDF